MKDKKPVIIAYSGGTCPNNSSMSGFGCILIENGYFTKLSGCEPKSNSYRSELIGVIEVLNYFKTSKEIHLFIDSDYVYNGIKEWIDIWADKNWVTKSGKPLANKDLWKKIYELMKIHDLELHKVLAKIDNELSIECKDMAKSAIQFHRKLYRLIKNER